MSKQPTGSYPKSQYPGQYPVQQSYPTQGFTQYGVQQQYCMQQQQQMPQQPIQPSTTYGYPRQNMQPAGYGVPPPPYTTSTDAPTLAPTPYSNPQPVTSGYSPYPTAGYPPQMNVVNPVPTGVFDAGARFTAGATVNIPPPPPGAMPTAAQVAAAQGQPVVMQQKQGSWFTGGSDGGTTFW